jgi:hypothetical protein
LASGRLQSPRGASDEKGMWNYVLRHRILLRAIYARSEALEAA